MVLVLAVVAVQAVLHSKDEMLAQIGADIGAILNNRNTKSLQMFGWAYAGSLEQLGRMHGARRQDNFATSSILRDAPRLVTFHGDSATTFEKNSLNFAIGDDPKIRPTACRVEKGFCRTPSSALAYGGIDVADALLFGHAGIVEIPQPELTACLDQFVHEQRAVLGDRDG